jgi:hypothetical protein
MRTAALVASTWLGLATALSLSQEKRGGFTIYKRTNDDDTDFFPFPANKSSIVSESTQPPGGPSGNLTPDASTITINGQIPRKFIETQCDDERKFKITDAWDEANLLAQAQTTFKLGYEYNIPHTQWLGENWNDESSWIPWRYDYRKLIGDNFRRLNQLFSDNAQPKEYIYWYCFDWGNHCGPLVQAYSWDSNGLFWSNHYTVFCPPFFNERKTLAKQILDNEGEIHKQKVMEYFQLNRGQIMFHEIWHYGRLVSSPRTTDYRYQAQASWELARDDGTAYAYVNADSYALDAVAIYVQQHYKSSMSPVPVKELSKFDAAAAAAVEQPPNDTAIALTFGDQPPPGWVAPTSSNGEPDLSLWTEVHLSKEPASASSSMAPQSTPTPAPAPQPDKNACHGINDDYWVMSRDVVVGNVKDFCGQTDQTKKYNTGSVNELELSVKKLNDDKKGPKDSPDCVARFQNAVIDGCDGGDSVNNPHNYKFGATLTTGDGWEYKMTPLSKQVNEVGCDVSYKFLYDAFEIRGKNFPDAKLGANGEGLHGQLSGCGDLTKWKFETTPDDCCFQWFASGQLPIGTKSCVGNAVESAGASSNGNCHGAGKRDVNARDSIDNWPGYGDENRHVFKNDTQAKRDGIAAWPGYGDEGRHVFKNGKRG